MKRIKFRLERLIKKHKNPRIKVLKVLESKTYNSIIFLTLKISASKNTRSKIILTFSPASARFFVQYLNRELINFPVEAIKI